MNFKRILDILNRNDLDTLDVEDRLNFARLEPMIVPFLNNRTIDELILFFKECKISHIAGEDYLNLIPNNLAPSRKTGTLLNAVYDATNYNYLYKILQVVDFDVFKTSSKCVRLLTTANFPISKEERTKYILQLPLEKRIEVIGEICINGYSTQSDSVAYRNLLDFDIIRNTKIPDDEKSQFMEAFLIADVINYNLFDFDQMSNDEKVDVFRRLSLGRCRDTIKINKPLSNDLLIRIIKECKLNIYSLNDEYKLPPEVIFEILKSDSENITNQFDVFVYRFNTNCNDMMLPAEYLPEILKLEGISEGAGVYLDQFFKKYNLESRKDVIKFIIEKYSVIRNSTFKMIENYLDDDSLKMLIKKGNKFYSYGYIGDPSLYLENIPDKEYLKRDLLSALLDNKKIKEYIKDDDNLRKLFELIDLDNGYDAENERNLMHIIYLRGGISNIPADIALKINLKYL